MNKTVAAVCAAVLVITFNSEKCFCSKISDVEKDVESYVSDDNGASNRVARQAYQGQTQIYPNLPSGPPYGLEPYPSYNNQNTRPGYNNPSGPYGQNPQPNAWQPNGQPNLNNPYATNNYTQPGYPNGYKPSNFTNNPSGHYGQYPQQPPNPLQPNGQQPNHNNPYGTNSQSGYNNYTQPGYPISNGYKPSNFSHNPTGSYGQSTPPYSLPNPYSSNIAHSPYSSNASNPYPGYKPTYNPSGRPPYHQPGQSHNNSYSGYPSYTTTPYPYPGYPSQRPPYYPGQSQTNNNTRPGNQHSVIYDDSTKRSGQNPYNSYNASNWSGNTFNNTYGRPPYNPQNGQSPQYFNSYPGSPGYGQQNSNNSYGTRDNQRPPYQNPHSGQQSSNGYPGHSSDSATFNLANTGYNPSIPERPPYGSSYGNGPYGSSSPNHFQYPNTTSYDPTRVSPQYFNSN